MAQITTSLIDSSEDTTSTPINTASNITTVSDSQIAKQLGIGVALLDDPVYGPELKEIFRLYRAGRVTEAEDKLAVSKIGQLDGDALNNLILKTEKSSVYQERLKEFTVRLRRVLRNQGLKATDEQLKDYFDRGIDEDIILEELAGGITSKEAAGATADALSTLRTVARNNGFRLEKDFGGQIDGWLQRIAKGESVDDFARLIRAQAKLGLPEKVGALLDEGLDLSNIFAPYRNTMAALLETTADAISLDDPLLRSAYGQDKEMSLYDFKRAVRKDPRWQYTDNAREDVSNAALGVLKDFGFQG